ncbi:EVE domain-containing protein [Lysinibacter cavernae]|uniref:UPF0310 protein FHX76_001335 n=1 Tax=Lysinibacter cavernae TaxID=1640652 RepID=A0A7X5TUD1_9MICO|nr:EVE domain-containing protein [Lysinibacter cavernae]NIH53467.1 hypothetical protein [Lysinibacter cavernae]
MNAWLGVVHADHVRRGVDLGIAQIHHGKRSGLARMSKGDWLVYYSPRLSMNGNKPLQAFTAVGQIADDMIYQAEDGNFRPYRRRVNYETNVGDAAIGPLKGLLDLTAGPNWGYQLRLGMLPLSEADLALIMQAMKDAG